MIRPRALLPLLASAGFLAACAYYNGLYNANESFTDSDSNGRWTSASWGSLITWMCG